jgi:hypothetical protein
MAICKTKVLVGNIGATVDFDLSQHLNSVIMVSCAASDTAGNNILRFYEVSATVDDPTPFRILGSAADFADTILGPTLVAATATTPPYARFTTGGAGEAAPGATLKVIGAIFVG